MTTAPITLYGCAPAFGLPDPSPFVTKTEVQLQMAHLPYRKVFAIPPEAPKGKLPYIDDAGEVVCDSSFIRAHLEHKHGVDLDAGLDARQRAEAWAIERMVEDHLYWAMVWFRWIDADDSARNTLTYVRFAEDGAPVVVAVNFAGVPHEGYRLAFPHAGTWLEALNTDAAIYGGSGVGNLGKVTATTHAHHGLQASALVRLPPLGAVVFRPDAS